MDPFGVQQTRNKRRKATRAKKPRLPSDKEVCTDAETVPEHLYVRRGQAPFTVQDSIGDGTIDIKDTGQV